MRAVVAAGALLGVLLPFRLSAQDSTRIAETQSVLAQLVETYGEATYGGNSHLFATR